jgi:ATP-dependent helicase/nuclease subunit A
MAEMRAVMSVSAVKELLKPAVAREAEDPAWPLPMGGLALRVPAFAAGAEPEGRTVGTACHRFLQHADLTRLAAPDAVAGQIAALVAAGRLAAEEASLVSAEEIAWFGQTPVGRLAATLAASGAGRVRREVPFVYALSVAPEQTDAQPGPDEKIIIRGVIDCLLDSDAGLIIVDYKTDRVADDAALAERVAGYTIQLQLYAQAASRIFARPVTRAVLVFLHARRVVEVPCTPLAYEALLGSEPRP